MTRFILLLVKADIAIIISLISMMLAIIAIGVNFAPLMDDED